MQFQPSALLFLHGSSCFRYSWLLVKYIGGYWRTSDFRRFRNRQTWFRWPHFCYFGALHISHCKKIYMFYFFYCSQKSCLFFSMQGAAFSSGRPLQGAGYRVCHKILCKFATTNAQQSIMNSQPFSRLLPETAM